MVSLNSGHCSYECTVLGSSERRQRIRKDYSRGQHADLRVSLGFDESPVRTDNIVYLDSFYKANKCHDAVFLSPVGCRFI